MRTAAVVGIALIGFAGATLAQPRESREPYSSADGKYCIKFAGAPKVSEKTTKSAIGDLTVHIATYALSDGSTYMVSYTDYTTAIEKENRAEFFNSIRDSVKNDGKVIGNEKEQTMGADKWPVREFTVEKNKQRIRMRLVLRENRLYQVVVIGTTDFVTSRDANAFFDSLELTK